MDFTTKHGLVLLEQLRKMREAEHLTDVVLVAEGVSFPCHRLVLSAFSPYFRVMFTCGLRECNSREIFLRDIPADSLALLLNYMYSSNLPLTNPNVQGISIAAFLLQMDDVFTQCRHHMTENMDASNCLGLFYFARDLGVEELADQAQRFMRQQFVQVCQNEEVLELEAHQLGKLISSDDLNISREETILDVVLRWAKHSFLMEGEVRSKHLPELLRKVRLPLINPDYLKETMKRNTALLADAECMEIMRQALAIVAMHPSAVPRKMKLRYGMETTDLLLCVGNDSNGIRSRYANYSERSFCYAPTTVSGEAGARRMSRQKEMNVELYRYKVEAQGSWERLTSAEYRDSYGLGSLGDTLYLIGGLMKLKNQLLITNCVERWSLQGGPWRSAAPLPVPLAYHSVVRLKDRLYVIGGRTPQSYRMDDEPDRLSNRLLEYDPNINKWTERGPMKYSKYRCSAVVLNGEIFVMGGIGCEGVDRGQSRRCLDAVELYNPDGDYWRDGPSLPCSQLSLRTNASNAGVVGGKIYVCGYYKGADRHDDITKDILELDAWENRWTVIARRALMHDNYDVCLVASLNPRGLISPPTDLPQ
ncbi:kelch repeat and BTB domain-containing protein 12 isoform X2 [Phycodurus eques]|uniref:kelch repeat and BTB domain-containing protein 12 isoform X2 n=1 Tax=Phycodurus eques TaxID=693459 RepID=UPI002ACEAA70|nr:kelch repeat and BTB domain-containing protein 12 isoform X2 [Phycodurus eques]